MGIARDYRAFSHHQRLGRFRVKYKETDLLIQSTSLLEKEAERLVIESRLAIEGYIREHPEFLHAKVPLPIDDLAPKIVREMLSAAKVAGVGPMASVAGAIAEYVGKGLLNAGSEEVIVENGGDCFISLNGPCTVGIWAGLSPFSGRIGVRIDPVDGIHGVCTSSGTIGHSLSLGKADAVTILAKSPLVADAVATSIGNLVQGGKSIKKALSVIDKIQEVAGGLIIVGEKMGAIGQIEVVAIPH